MTEDGRCPQFQTQMVSISLGPKSIIVPNRRCLLTERLISRLRPVAEAESLLRVLSADPSEDVAPSLSGPDFDAIAYHACTGERCLNRCSPSYRNLMAHFGLDDAEEIDCGVVLPHEAAEVRARASSSK